MQKVIVTGANGTGKSHLAARLHVTRPEVPVISYDSIKLTKDWVQRPQAEIEAKLSHVLQADSWILEGGPSLLRQAIPQAQWVIWLDPPEWQRAWRLFSRPWKHWGKQRPELPEGNVDWPLQQFRFAINSLRRRREMRNSISSALQTRQDIQISHITNRSQLDRIVQKWATGKQPLLHQKEQD